MKTIWAWLGLVVFGVSVNCKAGPAVAPRYTPTQLGESLTQELTNAFPHGDFTVLAQEAGFISVDPNNLGAVDQTALYSVLQAAFKADAALDWKKNQKTLDAAATSVANDIFPPPVDARHFASLLNQALTKYLPACPKLSPLDITREAAVIAAQCLTVGPVGNRADLYRTLQTQLKADPVLNLGIDDTLVDPIAAETAQVMYPQSNDVQAAVAPEYIFQADIPGTNSDRFAVVNFWGGAKYLRPYKINPSTMALEPGGTTTSSYIEVAFDTSYIFRSGKYAHLHFLDWPSYNRNGLQFFIPGSEFPDFSGRFGYVFNSGISTNISASTIVGSSDIYNEASIGFPVMRYVYDSSTRFQIDLPQINGGYATDKQFEHVHGNLFIGAGFQAELGNIFFQTNYPIYWEAQVGMAMIDVPKLSITGVRFNQNGGMSEPIFDSTWTPAFCTSLNIPIRSLPISLQAAADVYFSSEPGNWDITLGLSLELDKLAKGLGAGIGGLSSALSNSP